MHLPDTTHLQQEIDQLNEEMSRPETLRNAGRMKELAQTLGQKRSLLEITQRLAAVEQELGGLEEMLADPELAPMAEEDKQRLTTEHAALITQLKQLLAPRDPRDSRDIILEIRAGAGGEEAALFASELFRAYARYGEVHGWNINVLSQSMGEQGGYKEIIAEITGKEVFGTLKFERGVHRVQRVPTTEKMGRIHTSTVTVAVMPTAEEVDIEIRPEDLRIDTYRASGAGGQHVNKTSSAIRITHLPTNTVVACQEERSQHKNKEKAMRLLRSRLLEAQEEAQRQQQAEQRRVQVGTGDRSEKIRTYNFPQDRITDHRIKQSWSNIPGVLEGNWGEIFTTLRETETEKKLQTI